jgi:hypothetical protein
MLRTSLESARACHFKNRGENDRKINFREGLQKKEKAFIFLRGQSCPILEAKMRNSLVVKYPMPDYCNRDAFEQALRDLRSHATDDVLAGNALRAEMRFAQAEGMPAFDRALFATGVRSEVRAQTAIPSLQGELVHALLSLGRGKYTIAEIASALAHPDADDLGKVRTRLVAFSLPRIRECMHRVGYVVEQFGRGPDLVVSLRRATIDERVAAASFLPKGMYDAFCAEMREALAEPRKAPSKPRKARKAVPALPSPADDTEAA